MDAIKPCPADPNVYWGGTYTPPCCQDSNFAFTHPSYTGSSPYWGCVVPFKPINMFEDTKLANELEVERFRKKLDEVMEETKKMKDMKLNPVDAHQKVIDELHELYTRKNHDYGDSFHKTYLEEGLAMCRIRLMDKMERFKWLSRRFVITGKYAGEVGDESLRDTLMDLANYALMSVMELDREKVKRSAENAPNEIEGLD